MIDKQIDKAGDRAREERICWEIVESVNSIILRWDTNLKVTFINDYGQRFLGYRRDEIVGKSLIGTIVPATSTAGSDLAAMIRGIVLHPEQYVNNENENERRDGTRVWISWTNRAIRDSKGNVIEILSVGNDVTRRKRAEDALVKQLKMTQTLLDTIPIPVFYKDAKGVYMGCNQAFAAFLGKPKDEIVGKTVYEVAPQDLADVYHKADQELIHHPGTQVYETSVITVDGARHDVVFSKATFLNEDGTVGGLIGTIADITERKAMWQELVRARRELEQRVQERTKELEDANKNLRHEITEHKLDEEALKKRVLFEKLVTSLSSRFISLTPEEIDNELSCALKKIGEFAGVDRCYIGLVYDNVTKMDILYEWAAAGIEKYPQFYGNVPVDEAYPWSAGIMRTHEVLYVPDTEALPLEADRDKESLQAQQIKSVVVVPMIYKKSLIGIVGFDSVREKKAWSDDDIALLRIVGEIFVNALERKWIEAELRESEERFRAVFEQAAVGISLTSLEGITLRPNDKLCEITGYGCEELVGRSYSHFVYPEDVDTDRDQVRRLMAGEISSYSIDKRYVRKSGDLIWAHVTISIVRDDAGSPLYLIAIIQDITDRKRAEKELTDSRAWLNSIFRSAPTGIGIVVDRVIREANDRLSEMTGYSREELVGKSSRILYPSDEDYEYVGRVKYDKIRQAGTGSMETRWRRKDGGIRDIFLSSTALDRDNLQAGVTFTALDITDRNQAIEALRESEANLSLAQEIAHIGIWNWDVEMGILKWTDEVYRIFGLSPGTYTPTYESFLAAIIPEDRDRIETAVRVSLRDGSHYKVEFRIQRPDGERRYVNCEGGTIFGPGGKAVRMLGVCLDITERKQAEEALQESEEKFRTLAESSNAAITIFSDDKNIFVNRAAAEITGYTIEELMKIGPIMTISPDYRAQAMEIIGMLGRGERTRERLELEILRKDGSTRWVDVSAAPISYHGKNALISIALDITERKQAEEALKEAKARAELYLDLMGHDISNMNQAMMGYLEMAQELLDLKGHEELIERPLEIIRHSSRLIASVKKLELIQAGKYPIKTVDMCRALKEVCDTHAVVPGRDVNIRLSLAEGCLVTANDLLKDVFDNLVDNAIRHSTGPVTVDISMEPVLEDGQKCYKVSVSDNGPGIPDDLKRKIFRFIDVLTGSPGRRGLGLYMVKTLVESYRGRVWVEDRVPGDYHQGSRFVVLLPAAD